MKWRIKNPEWIHRAKSFVYNLLVRRHLNLWSNSKRIHLTIMFELIAIPYVTLNSVTFSIKCLPLIFLDTWENISREISSGVCFFPFCLSCTLTNQHLVFKDSLPSTRSLSPSWCSLLEACVVIPRSLTCISQRSLESTAEEHYWRKIGGYLSWTKLRSQSFSRSPAGHVAILKINYSSIQ